MSEWLYEILDDLRRDMREQGIYQEQETICDTCLHCSVPPTWMNVGSDIAFCTKFDEWVRPSDKACEELED